MAQVLEITVPLLILISLGFCSLIREYDLSTISNTAWVSEVPFTDTEIPPVGPFVLVHGLNYALIVFTLAITLKPYEPSQLPAFFTGELQYHLILTFIVMLYLLFFPLLEVTEYQDVSAQKGGLPQSMEDHFLYSSLLFIFILLGESLDKVYGPPATQDWVADFPIPELQMILLPLIFLFAGLAVFGFVYYLADEIKV